MKHIHIPVVLGTAREGHSSHSVAKAVQAVTKKIEGFTTKLVSVCEVVVLWSALATMK